MRTVRVSLRPLQLLSNRQNLPKEFKNLKTAGNPWENDFLSRLTLPSMNLSLRVVAGNLLQVSCTLEVPVTLAVTTE